MFVVITPCSLVEITDVSEEHMISISVVEADDKFVGF
jgi:hypothetical protein